MSIRTQTIRLAASFPSGSPERRKLLAALREANQVSGPGGLIFRLDSDAFSVRTKPSDPPYNQTYDASILVDRGSKKVYRAALEIIRQFWSDISRMKDIHEVEQFVSDKVRERVGKAPNWHSYSMPD